MPIDLASYRSRRFPVKISDLFELGNLTIEISLDKSSLVEWTYPVYPREKRRIHNKLCLLLCQR